MVCATDSSSLRMSSAALTIACATDAAVQEPPSTCAVGGHAERVGRDLRHDRIGAGADIGRGGGDLGVTISGQHDPGGERHLQGFPDAGRHAPPDQLTAVAHRARRRAALRPAEGLGALPVAFPELLAAVRQAAGLVAIGVAAQPQLQRIELQRDCKLIHRAFQRIDAGRRARRAHVARRRHIQARELVGISRIGGGIEQLRPAGVVAGEILVLRCHRDRLIADRIQPAACIGT
jgi:hypothetical protein